MDMAEERSENSASVGRESNTRLQWQRGTPVRAAGCETNEQGSSMLGLAVEQQWPEIDDLERRGRCRDEEDDFWVVLSISLVVGSAGTAF